MFRQLPRLLLSPSNRLSIVLFHCTVAAIKFPPLMDRSFPFIATDSLVTQLWRQQREITISTRRKNSPVHDVTRTGKLFPFFLVFFCPCPPRVMRRRQGADVDNLVGGPGDACLRVTHLSGF